MSDAKLDLKPVILNILKECKEFGLSICETRLVKIAYLLEVEFYREYRRRLTNAKWEFYKFGPFPKKFYGYLEDERIDVQDQEDFTVISLKPYSEVEDLPELANVLLEKILMDFGKLDLNKLLNFVYFETEPMLNAVPNKPLHFEMIKPREKRISYTFRISKKNREKLKRIKESIKNKLDVLPEKELREEVLKNFFEEDESFSLENFEGKILYGRD